MAWQCNARCTELQTRVKTLKLEEVENTQADDEMRGWAVEAKLKRERCVSVARATLPTETGKTMPIID